MNMPRVLLADDHRVLSEGLKSLLQPYFDVVGIVSDGRELVAAAKSLYPDVRRESCGADAPGKLTPRQSEVLQLVSEGRSAKQIGSILRISRRTAEFHKARAMQTLGVQNTAQLIQYAIRTGISSV
jgi:DNA-binding NarL/FixJ family response regulator